MRPGASTRLAAAVIAAVVALTAAGCTESDGTTAATPAVTPTCASPDYCPPASWDTAKASTPLAQIPAFSEPLNVVISARSTVSLGAIQAAMDQWDTVSTATTVTTSGIHLKCISSEQADVTGAGYVPQHVAWRLGGCVQGNGLSLTGDEDHARIWNQPLKGSKVRRLVRRRQLRDPVPGPERQTRARQHQRRRRVVRGPAPERRLPLRRRRSRQHSRQAPRRLRRRRRHLRRRHRRRRQGQGLALQPADGHRHPRRERGRGRRPVQRRRLRAHRHGVIVAGHLGGTRVRSI